MLAFVPGSGIISMCCTLGVYVGFYTWQWYVLYLAECKVSGQRSRAGQKGHTSLVLLSDDVIAQCTDLIVERLT